MSSMHKYKCSCGCDSFWYDLIKRKTFYVSGNIETDGLVEFEGKWAEAEDWEDDVITRHKVVCSNCKKEVPDNIVNDVLLD